MTTLRASSKSFLRLRLGLRVLRFSANPDPLPAAGDKTAPRLIPSRSGRIAPSLRQTFCRILPQDSPRWKQMLAESDSSSQSAPPWGTTALLCKRRASTCELHPKTASPYSSSFTTSCTRRFKPKAKSQKLEAFHKILPRHLPDFAGQFQFEQGGEDFGGRQLVFQALAVFVDVRGLVGFQKAQNSLFVRREPFVWK